MQRLTAFFIWFSSSRLSIKQVILRGTYNYNNKLFQRRHVLSFSVLLETASHGTPLVKRMTTRAPTTRIFLQCVVSIASFLFCFLWRLSWIVYIYIYIYIYIYAYFDCYYRLEDRRVDDVTINNILLFHPIKQMGFMSPCVCPCDTLGCVPRFFSYHNLTPSAS